MLNYKYFNMPHKCARCGKIYEDSAQELAKGCTCGARVFLYLRERPGVKRDALLEQLMSKRIRESDIEWLDKEFGDKLEKSGKIIHLDVENLERLEEGKFKLDIASLMSGKPLVVKAKDGVYYIDIPYAMKPKKKRR